MKPSNSFKEINAKIQESAMSSYANLVSIELILKVIVENSTSFQEILKEDKANTQLIITKLDEKLESITALWKESNPDYEDETHWKNDATSMMNSMRQRAKIMGLTSFSEINVVYEILNNKSFCTDVLNEAGVKLRSVEQAVRKNTRSLQSEGGEGAEDLSEENLKKFLVDMKKNAEDNNYDPMIGRQDELERMVQILSRKRKNNPVLIGDAGVGKTAIVEGFAIALADGKVHESLKDFRLLSLDLNAMVAGTRYRGDLEERLQAVIKHVSDGKTILFIDEIHALNQGETHNNVLTTLKPHLTGGKLRIVGATTVKEYRSLFEKDGAMSRRFNKVSVEALDNESTIQLLGRIKKVYEDAHSVKFADGVVERIVELAARFITNKQFPDKAIDLLDESGAYVKIHNTEKVVTKEVIDEIVAKIAKQPLENIANDVNDSLKYLSSRIASRVFGQDEAIQKVTDSVILAKSGFGDETKPLGSFLFVGPTGVGKTELAKQLSENLAMNLIRLDMSEYSSEISISKLVGSPAGYVGYGEGGFLTEKVNENPYSIVLFDEIEKAHPKIYNLFLQVLDYGFMTDAEGRKIDFRNTLIIFTSNAGVKTTAQEQRSIGFLPSAEKNESAIDKQKLELTFTPEFRNRLDGIVEFKSITQSIVLDIVNKAILPIQEKATKQGYTLVIDEAVIADIVKRGFKPEFGAREVNRTVRERLALPIAKAVTFGDIPSGSKLYVSLDGEEISVTSKKSSKKVELV